MPADMLREILQRTLIDPVFREGLFTEPEHVLADYTLTAEEVDALKQLTPDDIYAHIGRIAAYQLMPIRCGKCLVVVPDWLNSTLSPGDLPIRLNQHKTSASINHEGQPVGWEGSPVTPEEPLAFGSGLHPTTRLSLGFLENYLTAGETVLDLGTGSGILAIAAARLGASYVLALDTSQAAVQIAREHVKLNQVEQVVQVELGSVECLQASTASETRFTAQLIVANIFPSAIHSALQDGLVEALMPGGRMVLSGFRSKDLAEIKKAVEVAGLEIERQKQMADWWALISRRYP
jgi:ribosomal protein L11 methylase PrmA